MENFLKIMFKNQRKCPARCGSCRFYPISTRISHREIDTKIKSLKKEKKPDFKSTKKTNLTLVSYRNAGT